VHKIITINNRKITTWLQKLTIELKGAEDEVISDTSK
tara:strand:- start:10 stop:120 length:111 start_codon:yes stop_codon:yes gene_type:complete